MSVDTSDMIVTSLAGVPLTIKQDDDDGDLEIQASDSDSDADIVSANNKACGQSVLHVIDEVLA